MAHAQEARRVTEALGRLPEKERSALILRDVEGLSTEEVAQVLGSSATTVRSQVSKARVRLKKLLEGVGP
jgi:RNA polymerase sigma-70 factor (ECF subfamily)